MSVAGPSQDANCSPHQGQRSGDSRKLGDL